MKILRNSELLFARFKSINVRIRGSILLLALGALTAGCATKAQVSEAVSQPADELPAQALYLKQVEAVADSMAHAHIAEGFMPGMSVAVAKDGKIVFSRGYGLSDVEMGVAASPATVFPIASITKQFTAAAIMRLVEAGKIALDDPLTKYLPNYPVQEHQVTVRHLLNHTSGIKNYTDLYDDSGREYGFDLSEEEMIDLIAKQPFDFKPGEKFRYNNSGYFLLGVIIGKVTGVPYGKYIAQELLQPLGLEHTWYCDARRIIPNRAKGYRYEKDGSLVNAPVSVEPGNGAGALCSTVGDLVRWSSLLHSGKVVSPESLQLMTAQTELPGGNFRTYGFGLDLAKLGDHDRIIHTGDMAGFNTFLTHYPAEGLTIAVLANSDDTLHEKVEEALARTMLGMELPAVLDLPLTPADIARYEGTYTLQMGKRTADLRVLRKEGQLKVQLGQGKLFRLRYQGNDTFIPVFDDDMRIVFTVANGQAEGVALHQGNQSTPGTRKL